MQAMSTTLTINRAEDGRRGRPIIGWIMMRRAAIMAADVWEWVVWSVIWAATVMWVGWWIISSDQPRPDSKGLSHDPKLLIEAAGGPATLLIGFRFLATDGRYGSAFLFQAVPLLAVALLSYVAIEIRAAARRRRRCTTTCAAAAGRRFMMMMRSLRTYPVVIKGPLGIITAAELICILGFLSLVLFSLGRRTQLDFAVAERKFAGRHGSHDHLLRTTTTSLSVAKLGKLSYNIARSALIPLSLLLIPVSRGSPFLRLLDIPFERAVRYHVWLASLLLAMLTVHGAGYITFYVASDRGRQILWWKSDGVETCSIAAGLAALSVGFAMASTALPAVRRCCYELFLFVHVALSPFFFLFCLYHALWTLHFLLPAGLLFAVDRFLRFRQSRTCRQIVSARYFPCGAVQLRIAPPPTTATTGGTGTGALSSWYVHVPAVSKLQWHMFSALLVDSSSPESPYRFPAADVHSIFDVGDHKAPSLENFRRELAFVVKPVGGWSRALARHLRRQHLNYSGGADTPPVDAAARRDGRSRNRQLEVRLEGPYGHEYAFYLTYRTLVLVAGGIGITPVLSMLHDVLLRHRQRDNGDVLPSTIILYYCVRSVQELCVLNSLDPQRIFPDYAKRGISVRVFAYVTRWPSLVIHSVDVEDAASARAVPTTDEIPTAKSLCIDRGAVYDLRTFDLARYFVDGETPELEEKRWKHDGESTSDGNGNHAKASTIDILPESASASTMKGEEDEQDRKGKRANVEGGVESDGDGGVGGEMRMISSKGETVWVALTTLATTVVFYVVWGLSNVFVVKKRKKEEVPERQQELGSEMLQIRNYEEVDLVVGCIVVATVVTGGVMTWLWAKMSMGRRKGRFRAAAAAEEGGRRRGAPASSPWEGTLHFGCRPLWTEIFQCLSKEFVGQTVGVLVSGPQGMQQDIAMECKRQTKFFSLEQSTIFHFHSVSFEI